jgi:hypothetical protein
MRRWSSDGSLSEGVPSSRWIVEAGTPPRGPLVVGLPGGFLEGDRVEESGEVLAEGRGLGDPRSVSQVPGEQAPAPPPAMAPTRATKAAITTPNVMTAGLERPARFEARVTIHSFACELPYITVGAEIGGAGGEEAGAPGPR